MTSRTDSQLDSSLTVEVNALLADFRDLKVSNQFIGPDSVQTNLVATTNTSDISASIAPYVIKTWRVTYIPSKMSKPYAVMTLSNSFTNSTGFEVVSQMPDTGNTSPTSQAWLLTVANDANTVTYTAKFFIKSVDTGSLTVVAV